MLTENCWAALIIIICLVMFTSACSVPGLRETAGENIETDVIVFFHAGTDDEAISHFWQNVISVPGRQGKGFAPLPGISAIRRAASVQNHEAITIDFTRHASSQQRELVMNKIRASPLVYKVLEHVVPADVRTLE